MNAKQARAARASANPPSSPSPITSPKFRRYRSHLDLTGGTPFGVPADHPQSELVLQTASIMDKSLEVDCLMLEESATSKTRLAKWKDVQKQVLALASAASEQIKLDFRGSLFTTCKSTLLKTPWFEAQVSRWQPDDDTGAYFIDRNPRFVWFILEYLRTGKWNVDSLDRRLLPEFKEELAYFLIEDDGHEF